MQSDSAQIMLLPSQSDQYEDLVGHRSPDDDDFGVLEDDENVEELIEEDEDDDYVDELGNPVFIGAHDDSNYILDDDLSQQGTMRTTSSYQLKYIRTRRMDKLIDNVVVSASRRDLPVSADSVEDSSYDPDGDRSGKIDRYQCDQCPRTFKFQSKLDEHRRAHLGVRPFRCLYCIREFTQKGALKTHMRLHTGERPFVCQWECGKHFASASARRHHEKTHSGERPYICSVCGKGFTKNSHVVRHLKNIHNTVLVREAIMRGEVPADHPASNHIVDIVPRGKELHVVNDIVEQIHEEKFSERLPM